MTTDLFPKGKHPRNFTAEERRERFLAHRVKALAGEPIEVDDSTAWHEVNEPLTSRQRKQIPDAVRDRYSPRLWLKLLEPGTDRVIRCKGRYDHISAWSRHSRRMEPITTDLDSQLRHGYSCDVGVNSTTSGILDQVIRGTQLRYTTT
jgi:hypothetical protein